MGKLINKRNIDKGLGYLKKNGFKKLTLKVVSKIKKSRGMLDYNDWRKYAVFSEEILEKQRNSWKNLGFKGNKPPVFSIIIPAYNTDKRMLESLFASIKAQTYPLFEVVISDGSEPGNTNVQEITQRFANEDDRFKYIKVEKNLGISGNTNFGMERAEGNFVALCDHDALLPPWALFSIAEAISNNPEAEFIYTDEDKIDTQGNNYFDPYFKTDFNLELLNTNNYICHFSVFSKKLQKKVGLFNGQYDGAQDFDYFLRCTEELEKEEEKKLDKYREMLLVTKDIKELSKASGLSETSVKKLLEGRFVSEKIIHIPWVCYHWRCSDNSTALNVDSKPYASMAGSMALKAHYDRLGIPYRQVSASEINQYTYETKPEEVRDDMPLISVIIPNKDNTSLLDRCIRSICEKSTYRNLEFVVVENNSQNQETFEYYNKINNNTKFFVANDNQTISIKVVTFEGDFNFSAINNFGFGHTTGEFVLLLNNDTELINPDSINEMYGYLKRSNTAVAGAKLVYEDGTIQHGGIIIGHGGIAGEAYKGYADNEDSYMNKLQCTQNFSAVTGACLMAKRSVYERVGGLDEKLAVAFNDVDFCLKARQLGFLVTYTPHAKLYHYESKTRGSDMTEENIGRLREETEYFLGKWGDLFKASDPYYNQNLSLLPGHFELRLLPDEKIGEIKDPCTYLSN